LRRYENGNWREFATNRRERDRNYYLTNKKLHPIVQMENLMIYIQIPEANNAIGFVTLAKSGTSVLCLPENTYGVALEHLKLLRRKRIPFKKLEGDTVRLPQPSRPHDEKI
jgi:hypothetical protein